MIRSLACGLFLLAAIHISEAAPREPAALIYQISGEALWIAPGRSPQPLRLLDRLPAGTVLELKPGSHLALAFVTGRRYEISGPARVTLGPGDLAARSGDVRPLPTVPTLPHLAGIDEDEQPGPEAGAVRIRGRKPEGAGSTDLSKEDTEARERLRKAADSLGDKETGDLLIAVDRSLGLAEEGTGDGAVIESVAPRSPGEAAGLQPGDVIVSWSCALPEPASGAVHSPYDLLLPETEEAPRRPVLLLGRRGDQERTWRLTAGEWGIETRPLHPDRFAAWRLQQRARELVRKGKMAEADAGYAEALDVLQRESAPLAAARLLFEWGKALEFRGALDEAADRYQKTLALARSFLPKSLTEAAALTGLGIVAAKQGDYPGAEKLLRQALAIREELAPGTAEVTGSLNNLGILARHQGDFEAAEKYLSRGEEMQRRIAPESTDHALFFQNLGVLALSQDDLRKAEPFLRQALAIFENVDPKGRGVADCLDLLANVLMQTGDLATADDLLHRSLTLQEQERPGELGMTSTWISLGNLAERRGDLEAAETQYRRALAIQEKLSPDPSLEILGSLGLVEGLRGAFPEARRDLGRALALFESRSSDSLGVAVVLEQLGQVEIGAGAPAVAEALLRRSLAIYEKNAPESLDTADILRDLGEVASLRGRPDRALAFHRRALDLRRRLAPGTTAEAEALHLLGSAERRVGRARQGTRDLCGAIDVLDRQRSRLGGTPEARTSFESSLGDYYNGCLAGLLQLGRTAEAFHALERGRARSFLALLSERDLRLADLSPELAAERRRTGAEYDGVQDRLAHLRPGRDDAEIERLTGQLLDLRAHQEEIRARIRRESPRSAALQDPQPLDLSGVRSALDPGTVLLEYVVDRKETRLFVVQPAGTDGPGLSVLRIGAGKDALRAEVERFRRLLERPGSDRAALQARARRLYRLLVLPAESRIAGARRVLVSPDGPLHSLSFAALMRGDRYLVEWKPVHSVLSATVYAELRRSRPARPDSGQEPLVAFGDPTYPLTVRSDATDPQVRDSLRRGLNLEPLPSTRKEVEAIASLFPRGHEYLGREATEEKAKSLAPDTRLVHFACHGLLDERFPLNSALALSLPEHPAEGQDNGLLQAWEIFESVRLDADLVTLSACDTALGKEMGGEGLVGLTRAFQYAGARSVLASLWGIADYSTAGFMKDFYGHLRAGQAKDEALQAAQIDQIRKKSHPFFWAAFQLTGDWR